MRRIRIFAANLTRSGLLPALFGYTCFVLAVLGYWGAHPTWDVVIVATLIVSAAVVLVMFVIRESDITELTDHDWISYHVTYSQKTGRPKWVKGLFKFNSYSTSRHITGSHRDESKTRFTYEVMGKRDARHYLFMEKSSAIGDDCLAFLMDTEDEGSDGVITGKWVGPGNDKRLVFGPYILSRRPLTIEERKDILERQTKVWEPDFRSADPESEPEDDADGSNGPRMH